MDNSFAYFSVATFARQKGISSTEAFNYLYMYKGIDFLVDCYDFADDRGVL